ncbi:MAG: DUF4956 domain-containing protein [Propionibacteriaceae bacterium]|jgi:hypothetical protein|nr:DUF4956 domain-containing protein [Propionibacteriaceae bacterium]
MFSIIIPGIDLVAIALLTLGLFYPRHKRGDLVVAYLALNIGVMAVAIALSTAVVTAGLGLGIFGVLSIIRLRSMELDQHEIAYYFSALALGLIGGLGEPLGWVAPGLMAAIVLVIALADSPKTLGKFAIQTVVLDHAATSSEALRQELEEVVGGRVISYTIRRRDLVNDLTEVGVRYCEQAGYGSVAHDQALTATESVGVKVAS